MFPKFSSYDDLDMINLGDVSPGSSGRNWKPIPMSGLDYLIFYCAPGVLPSAASPAGEWTLTWHTEGETESQWHATAVGKIHPKVFQDVQYVVGMASMDYENPKHLKAIWDFIKKSAGVLSAVSGAASPFLPPQLKVPAIAVSTIAGAVSAL